MNEEIQREAKEKYELWKGGKLSNEEFMVWLVEQNDEGKLDNDTYFKLTDEIDCNVFSDNDVATFG